MLESIPARAPRRSGDVLNVTYRVVRPARPYWLRWCDRLDRAWKVR